MADTHVEVCNMQAARADNFYYPPEWDPTKGNLDKVRPN